MTDRRPDIVLVLADDLGFSDLGCYGGEIETPNLDRAARAGIRFTQFYNSPRCSPSRASLLTGQHPHRVGVGVLTFDERPHGYPGNLSDECVTAAEVLREAGYGTYLSGKWHVASDMVRPNDSWPTRRGFDRFYGTIDGAGSYYQPHGLTRDEENVEHETEDPAFFYTDALSSQAVAFIEDHHRERRQDPLFLYLAYTAPHWPLHAVEEDIARYRGRFDAGWDVLRRERLERQIAEGVIEAGWPPSERDPDVLEWSEVDDPEWEARRMEVYAAQVSRMDAGIGRVLDTLKRRGRLDNTVFLFLSDNGGCAEEVPFGSAEHFAREPIVPDLTRSGAPLRLGNEPAIVPGPEDTFASYGRGWANLSNTPFREYKHWVHEGGIATPFIVHWPAGLRRQQRICTVPRQLVDVLPTFIELAGAEYPLERAGRPVPPPAGESILPLLLDPNASAEDGDRTLFWEHEGNAGVRRGRWKLVRKFGLPWELYDVSTDRMETTDVAHSHAGLVKELVAQYEIWAEDNGILPWQQVLDGNRARASTERGGHN